jgi:hypothetical protein
MAEGLSGTGSQTEKGRPEDRSEKEVGAGLRAGIVEGESMTIPILCKLCGSIIYICTGSFDDQMAQEKGFCCEVHRADYEAQKAADMAANRG